MLLYRPYPGAVSGPRVSTDIHFRRQSNLIHLLFILDLAVLDSSAALPLITGPPCVSERVPLECWGPFQSKKNNPERILAELPREPPLESNFLIFINRGAA